MGLRLITGPSVEPISLTEAKLHLRVDGSSEDDLINIIIKTARLEVETLSLHKLITQTWDWFLDGWPDSPIEVPYPPLQSVTSINYTLEGASEAVWSSANYSVDAYSVPGWIVLQSTASPPSGQLIEANGVRMRFVCGFGDAGANVDYRARQAMLLLIGHYYEHREEVIVERGVNIQRLPMAAGMLCNDLRMKVKRF